jgi:hypothetical protein
VLGIYAGNLEAKIKKACKKLSSVLGGLELETVLPLGELRRVGCDLCNGQKELAVLKVIEAYTLYVAGAGEVRGTHTHTQTDKQTNKHTQTRTPTHYNRYFVTPSPLLCGR